MLHLEQGLGIVRIVETKRGGQSQSGVRGVECFRRGEGLDRLCSEFKGIKAAPQLIEVVGFYGGVRDGPGMKIQRLLRCPSSRKAMAAKWLAEGSLMFCARRVLHPSIASSNAPVSSKATRS